MAAVRPQFEMKAAGLPAAPPSAALFKKPLSSLQTMLIEKLLANHKEMKLSEPIKEGIKTTFRPRLMQELVQALIDDNHQSVRTILDFDPALLLVEPASVGVKEIESKKTWQRFLTERPFIMAQKLKRLVMTKTLIPYMEQLNKKGETPEIVKQWILPPLASVEEQKKQDKKNEKLQQEYIKKYFEPLINTIKNDDKVKVKWELNNETKLYEARIEGMKEETRTALESFRKQLLPDAAITIDDDVDNQQFQIAAFKAYDTLFDEFKNWDQRNSFTICGIGFPQSLSAPELGAIYCESLYDVVNSKKPLSARAMTHKMEDGRNFYRLSRDSSSGLGLSFLCSIFGHAGGRCWPCGAPAGFRRRRDVLENYVKQTQQSLANLRDECIANKQSMLPQLSNRGL